MEKINSDYKTISEIGAGYGANLLFFKNIGKEVFGLEPSKISTKIAIDDQINIKQGFVEKGSETMVRLFFSLSYL